MPTGADLHDRGPAKCRIEHLSADRPVRNLDLDGEQEKITLFRDGVIVNIRFHV